MQPKKFETIFIFGYLTGEDDEFQLLNSSAQENRAIKISHAWSGSNFFGLLEEEINKLQGRMVREVYSISCFFFF